mmetsp:Transcript_11560/g.25277  ORF Transcript_11560/g.25277 Transcript_11560/m.25277 type:complete len:308 (-) Transcript_11560:113-1036(-)|eukprot:CAMPEP_0116895544 /NCGR_PEP_ID=MMETSP0467-20121206/5046_1 /TAXON_ID=283647 /ORGANISM="Mesodinium pulex, Strain SPMC105" /LENGTH=307 /DNA_ID=CAMNT_0004566337 /DNA_START=44 /DNA_END=967 /DNA_ORIENTATION=+
MNIIKWAVFLPKLTLKIAQSLSVAVFEQVRVLLAQPKSLEGEVCVITGAGSGIGRLLSIELAKRGVIMILWDINIAGAEETAEMIRKIGGSATAFKVDVTNREEVYRIAQQVRNEIAEVTMLINNAGIVSGKKIFDPDNSDGYMEKTMQVNTISHFWTVKAFMPAMIAKDHGHLITIASSAGLVGVNGLADYCASKFGAVGFHESVTQELHCMKKKNVKTLCVNPFYINTGMFDGVTTKNELLLPILEPSYVVSRIMTGITKNMHVVYMPWLVSTLHLLKCFPLPAQNVLSDFLGVGSTMDEFKGRK